MNTATPTLSLEHLSIDIETSRGLIHPVRDVSLEIARGEMLGLVGESGSGKSVTAMTITRLLPRRSTHVVGGSIQVFGTDITHASEKELRRIRGSKVGVIFQEPMTALNPVFTVGDQIGEPLRRHLGMSRKQARERSRELLDMVGIRDSARVVDDHPFRLSGGMRQRVMIAMAMACEPDLLIADEPTTALDVTTQLQILDLIVDLQESHGTSVLLITHDLGVVAQTCSRVAVMHDGHLEETASVWDLFARPEAEYTRHLLSAIPQGRRHSLIDVEQVAAQGQTVSPEVATGPTRSDSADGGSAHSRDSRATTEVAPTDPVAPTPEPLLRVRNLVKTFPARSRHADPVLAVQDVSFDVPRGGTLAIVGESGSGKSTTGRAVLRLHEPTSGTVEFDGTDLLALDAPAMRAMRARLQIVFQDTYATLDPRWVVGRLLAEPLRLHTDMDRRQVRERIAEVLTMVGLDPDSAQRFPHEFSGGQRQRIGIARALLLNPELVVCDEAVSALDVSVQAQVLELMKDLQEELGLTYIFISHDLSVVESFADHVLVMSHGRVVEQGTTEDVFGNPRHPYTQALLAAVPAVDPSERTSREQRRALVLRGLAAADDLKETA
ncbi:MAG: ABC transporter ATP-binding protein [Propionibacterium sp.]|nr:ABC transporter ATP-binding protein [Propionibacterium sp.]